MIQIVIVGEVRFMDMLYRAYSNPLDLMKSYINRRRFGEFVDGFLAAERDRMKAEAEKDEFLREWIAYVHSDTTKSFYDWRADLIQTAESKKEIKRKTGGDLDLDDAGIDAIMRKMFG